MRRAMCSPGTGGVRSIIGSVACVPGEHTELSHTELLRTELLRTELLRAWVLHWTRCGDKSG